MRVTLLSIGGSRSDVQPLIALGAGLQATGDCVSFATHEQFEPAIRRAGLGFVRVTGDPAASLRARFDRAESQRSKQLDRFGRAFIRSARPVFGAVMRDCWNAARECDLIIADLPASGLAVHFVEKRWVPLVRTHFAPVSPTRYHRASFHPDAHNLGGPLNLLTHRIARQVAWLLFRELMNRHRRQILDLAPLGWREPFGRIDSQVWPMLYSFSPTLFPPPPDWDRGIHVTGYWYLDQLHDWQPPRALVDFLDSGSPPVYVGFGSLPSPNPEKTTRDVVAALRRAGQRGILYPGGGGLARPPASDDILVVDDTPHEWLFPRMAAVVHHGGAGTTAAALRAGVPSVVVPIFADQPLWGSRVHALGIGPRPIPRQQLTAERLAAAIAVAAGDPAIRARAASVADTVRTEDGVARAVEISRDYVGGRALHESARLRRDYFGLGNRRVGRRHDAKGTESTRAISWLDRA